MVVTEMFHLEYTRNLAVYAADTLPPLALRGFRKEQLRDRLAGVFWLGCRRRILPLLAFAAAQERTWKLPADDHVGMPGGGHESAGGGVNQSAGMWGRYRGGTRVPDVEGLDGFWSSLSSVPRRWCGGRVIEVVGGQDRVEVAGCGPAVKRRHIPAHGPRWSCCGRLVV